MKLLYVEWIDSVSCGGGIWADKENVIALESDTIKSVGWLVRETDKDLTIVAHAGGNQHSGDMCIPKCSIKKRRVLKQP